MKQVNKQDYYKKQFPISLKKVYVCKEKNSLTSICNFRFIISESKKTDHGIHVLLPACMTFGLLHFIRLLSGKGWYRYLYGIHFGPSKTHRAHLTRRTHRSCYDNKLKQMTTNYLINTNNSEYLTNQELKYCRIYWVS